ncbi:hypothetical protein QBC44DRAFT_363870 [Cladorrhinum sp. PSN332]|nr:hypothetical protein QBC44DRAFT_363870 [Cladorrhinum sp. PSN332]
MYDIIVVMISAYFNRIDPSLCPDNNPARQPQPPLQHAGPVEVGETQFNDVSDSPTTSDPRPDHIEKNSATPALSFSEWDFRNRSSNPAPRGPFPLSPLVGFFGGMRSTGNGASSSDRVLDAEDLATSTGRSMTPSTERSNVPSVTTAESRADQKSSSSTFWALFGNKDVSGSGKSLQIEEPPTEALRSANATSPRACLTLDCKRLGRDPNTRFREDLTAERFVEIDSSSLGSDEASSQANMPKGRGSRMHEKSEPNHDERKELSRYNNLTAEDNYWKWDQQREQFIHLDVNTGKSVACPNWFD